MKIILLHDWLVGFRGGERILEAFCEIFPQAPIYCLFYKKGSTSEIIENRKIIPSFLQKLPSINRHYRKILPLFPLAVQTLKLEKADLVLSSSHCVIKGVKKPLNSRHICFTHSPMRYLYDQYEVYLNNAPLHERIGMRMLKNYLIKWDLQSNQNVDHFVANSYFVKQRITNIYKRNASVIHPFVDWADFVSTQKDPPLKEDFYLVVGAFAPNKRVDIAIEVFNKTKKHLKIIGKGQQEKKLRRLADKNIEFLGQVSRKTLINYLAKAKALIFPGVEDFGIVPLEALAAGTPVIAYKKGGVLETLDEDTAQFFLNPTTEDLKDAVTAFEKRSFDKKLLFAQAEQFSKEKFKKEIKRTIDELMAK